MLLILLASLRRWTIGSAREDSYQRHGMVAKTDANSSGSGPLSGGLEPAVSAEKVTVAMHITRKQATKLIEALRASLAGNLAQTAKGQDPNVSAMNVYLDLTGELEAMGVPPLVPCDGEAHSNPYIDNCHRCMPRWGLVGESVVVR